MSHLLSETDPTVVGITAKMGNGARRMRKVVETIRSSDRHLPVAVGGPLVASYPDIVDPLWNGIDALFLGDGEDTMVEWVAAGSPSGALFGPAEVGHLDRVGVPAWWDGLEDYVWPAAYWPGMGVAGMHLASGRGCTRRCTFCYLNSTYLGNQFRFVSAERLMLDVQALADRFDVRGFYFVDDCFIDRQQTRVRLFCDLNVGTGSRYRYGCDIQLDDLERTDLLARMHDAGFRSLYLGIEAASASVRRDLAKGRVRGDVALAIQRVLDMGFRIRASIGIGWPGETEQDIEDTARSHRFSSWARLRRIPLPSAAECSADSAVG